MASLTIIHIDMDAFFAAVEQLDNPALQSKCVVVGGSSQRGVVAAASYEARKYGIHSAMPIFQAKQKCADLIIVPPRRKRYSELSQRFMSILETFSPLVEPVSIDEAFVDISGCRRLHGDPCDIAVAIKRQIKKSLQLTCSIGLAPNKFLAKIASDMDKPDGLTIIEPQQVNAFIQRLPIRKVPGVGQRAQKRLAAMGIQTLGQVRRRSSELLARKLGKFGQRLMALSQGHDDSPVTPRSAAKSISSETTLSHDTLDRAQLASQLLVQSQSVARQLRRHHMRARTITLKIKTSDFQRHTRNQTLDKPVQSSDKISQIALTLLQSFPMGKPVRLVGVGASGLMSATMPIQADLFPGAADDKHRRWEKVDRAVDAIDDRFGRRSIVRGSLAPSDKKLK